MTLPHCESYLCDFAVHHSAEGASTEPRPESFEETNLAIDLDDVLCWESTQRRQDVKREAANQENKLDSEKVRFIYYWKGPIRRM